MHHKLSLMAFLLLAAFACAERVVGFPAPDETAPTVLSNTPLSDSVDGEGSAPISVTFSEPLDPATVNGTTFTVLHGTVPVPGTVSLVGVTARFAPSIGLVADGAYTATVTTGVSDLAGNHLAEDHIWRFKIGRALDEIAPLVVATNPFDGALGVARDANVLITFSEAMDAATLAGAITLMDGDAVVAGAVSGSGLYATFNPTDLLVAGREYTARVGLEATDLAGNPLGAAASWGFTVADGTDQTRPEVVATNPLNDATGVALDANLIATFSEAMDSATVIDAFTLLNGDTPVPGTVTVDGVNATFDPTAPLVIGETYTARITAAVADLAGNTMATAYEWRFTTGTVLVDNVAPIIIATNPADDAFFVPSSTQIIATFSEPMDPDTFEGAFTVRAGAQQVPGVITIVGFNAFFNPDNDLAGSTLYTATITNAVTDLSGNAMVADYTWQFTTGFALDNTRPVVIDTFPDTDAVGVPVGSAITATFSELMDATTVLGDTFQVFDGLVLVPGVVTFNGLTATYTPTFPLNPNTRYLAIITDDAADLAGNTLAEDYVWAFTTGDLPDTRQPRVTFTVPTDDATGVSIGAPILVVFTEDMDADFLTDESFVVQRFGADVPGEVSVFGLTATFRPTLPLVPNSFYSAVVTTATRDLAGNRLEREFVWGFRTGSVEDTTRPQLISSIPADLTLGVALNADAAATFNEAMDPRAFDVDTFVVQRAGVAVNGVVTVIGAEAVFHPNADWLPNTVYSASIAAAASDLDGNTLGQNATWTFTTGAAADVVAPFVAISYPADAAVLVPATTTITATFSEGMDAATVNTATFIVTGPGGFEVVGTVRFDATTLTGTFSPQADLLPATRYTVTVGVEALDLARNPMVFDHVWAFTTGLVPDGLEAVELGTLRTFAVTAGAGLFNSNVGGPTTLNGDVGLNPLATCLGDGLPCTLVNPLINGTLYANDPNGVAVRAKADLAAAYAEARGHLADGSVSDLAGLVLMPGVYDSATAIEIANGGTVVLDAQGDAGAVWIFQAGTSLTLSDNAQVELLNGARAENVFWAVGTSAGLGEDVLFQGNLLVATSTTLAAGARVIGRVLSRDGQLNLQSSTITLPAW